MNSFQLGQMPWIRSFLREHGHLRCPFCGDETLISSAGDIPEDDLRIEVYCDNDECEVRTTTIVAMRIGVPNDRSDVRALEEVDGLGATAGQRSVLERRRGQG
jgi:hypothetical protein